MKRTKDALKKINFKASKYKDLNVRAKTLKLLEENGKMLMTGFSWAGNSMMSWEDD